MEIPNFSKYVSLLTGAESSVQHSMSNFSSTIVCRARDLNKYRAKRSGWNEFHSGSQGAAAVL
jgi:hypothetical protein